MQSISQENNSIYTDNNFIQSNSEFELLCFLDEVGRGPLAGPVVSCSVFVSSDYAQVALRKISEWGVTDSKKISKKKREKILSEISFSFDSIHLNEVYFIDENFGFVISSCNESEIDEINILNASLLSMKRCLSVVDKKIRVKSAKALLDGNKSFIKEKFEIETLIKGDLKSQFIGLASIIAKVYRDTYMERLDQKYPEYGFSKHAGYPTKLHKESIKNFGVTKVHRKSFKGVKEYC